MALITISRGTFGGGRAVADELARRLGYPCVSREMIVQAAAETFGISKERLTDAMMESPGFWRHDKVDTSSNVNFVRYALLNMLKKDQLVYHGYIGNLLLSDVSKVLRVRIVASMEFRINCAMEDHGIGRDEAVALIGRDDKNHARWARLVLGIEWDDPSLYDVILNLDHFSIPSAVSTIEQMCLLEEFKMDEDSRQSLEDLIVCSRIWAALTKNRPTRSAQVQIHSHQGLVTIRGDVGSTKLADAIVCVVKGVPGVQEVVCELSFGATWMW